MDLFHMEWALEEEGPMPDTTGAVSERTDRGSNWSGMKISHCGLSVRRQVPFVREGISRYRKSEYSALQQTLLWTAGGILGVLQILEWNSLFKKDSGFLFCKKTAMHLDNWIPYKREGVLQSQYEWTPQGKARSKGTFVLWYMPVSFYVMVCDMH